MLHEDPNLYQNEFLCSFGDKFLKMFSFLKQDLKILASFLSVEDNTENIWNKPTLKR